ncbi:carbohydrate kinase family protein [Aureitalea marina]|uniref:Carbohydrate kinase PfkB domain-containing protein n=1 Tax=Aureitalea marina TaxID=930804 RepID=A0A2S7KMR8_9FLAO|nr:carbohydrate kinase [Aureitalea marina]PQB03926.1 hypothetical protein BST85_02630 [Aureitalea marina]
MKPQSRIFCFGEVLWDVFPDNSRIGGAPLNVATKLATFGHQVFMVSAVGRDKEGDEILEFLEERNVISKFVKTHPELSTGKVLVQLDEEGKASYQIVHPVAWDDITVNKIDMEEMGHIDLLVFGSLACRDKRSRRGLQLLMEQAEFKVLDINLRAPHYQYELLIDMMQKADFVKFNDEEIIEISRELGRTGDFENLARELARQFQIDAVCVTLGEDGAILLYQGKYFHHPGFKVQVRDTVGAGDSFLATILNELLSGNDPKSALTKACAMGAMVASKDGANPEILSTELFNFLQDADI